MTLQQLRYALTIAGCGSMNEAAKRLFLSQPSLSETVKELEQEIGLQIFMRSNRGIIITPEGEEFLGYARQVIDQYGILKARYVEKQRKEKFSVSMQHYTFAVKAFVETVKKAGMDSYEFAANETTTYDVMENVRNFKSEIGVLYLNDFNADEDHPGEGVGVRGTVCLRYLCLSVVGTSACRAERDLHGRTGRVSVPVL